jgi:hypothetical protein
MQQHTVIHTYTHTNNSHHLQASFLRIDLEAESCYLKSNTVQAEDQHLTFKFNKSQEHEPTKATVKTMVMYSTELPTATIIKVLRQCAQTLSV